MSGLRNLPDQGSEGRNTRACKSEEDTVMNEDRSVEDRARRAAKRVGLQARKSRKTYGTLNNQGGFCIFDPHNNWVVIGEHHDLSADDVIAFCEERS